MQRQIELAKVNSEFAQLNQKLEELANTDMLTGLANRRHFFERFTEAWALAERKNQPLGCIMLDIDRFKFVNDTPHYLLIETETDLKAGTVTFRFYSTKTGRTVEMEGPFEANVVPHGSDVYQEDPTLPKGTTKQIDWAHDGLDVTVYRIVKEGDKVFWKDTFFSRYRPWQAVYLVGTGERS